MRAHRRRRAAAAMALLTVLLIVATGSVTAQAPPPPVSGADRTNSGCTTMPMTAAGSNQICYRVSVGIIPNMGGQQLQLWMHARNVTTEDDLDFVVCAMINADTPDVSHDRYDIELVNGQWVFPNHQNPGSTSWPVDYHFGCDRTQNLPPGSTANPFDRRFSFVDGAGQTMSVTPSDLRSVYWDLLVDGSIDPAGNAAVDGHNNFLAPGPNTPWQAFNIWAGTFAFDPEGSSSLTYDLGNWVTMAYPGIYEAVFVGRVFDAPPGTLVTLTLGEQVAEFEVGPEAEPLEIPFVIDSSVAEVGRVEVFADPKALQEGQWVSLQAQVFAMGESEFYTDGDFMYAVASNFVQDTVAPDIVDSAIALDDDDLVTVRALAFDASSMPTAASVEFLVAGEPIDVFGLDFSMSAEAQELMDAEGITLFETSLDYADILLSLLEAGEDVAYRVTVVDEGLNLAQTPELAIDPGSL